MGRAGAPRVGVATHPCNPTPPPRNTPQAAPGVRTPLLKAPDNRDGWEGGGGKRGGERGEELFREKVGFEFLIVIIFHLLVHQLKS